MEDSLQNVADLGCGAVQQHAYTVDLCGDHTDADNRANQNADGNQDLIPSYRTHGNSGKHSHGRGKGDIGADLHEGIIHAAGGHGEHDNRKSDDKQVHQRQGGSIDIFRLGGRGADRTKEECSKSNS